MSLSSAALDLPIKRVGGVDRYYYAVKRGDTVLSIAQALGITRNDIIRYNPSAADGVRQGATLYFPVDAFSKANEARPAAAPGERSNAHTGVVRHKVERGETLFGLAHKYGISPDDIIALNPGANDGIKAGEYLNIPGQPESAGNATANLAQEVSAPSEQSQVSEAAPEQAAATPAAETAAPTEITGTRPELQQVDNRLKPVDLPLVEKDDATSANVAGSIAVLLPLKLNDEAQDKHSRLATEFVRGLVLGAEKAGLRGDSVSIRICDTQGSHAEISSLLRGADLRDIDIIVGPEDIASLDEIIAQAPQEALIFNILAVQDTSYLHNDRVIQANIPHSLMYEKALQGLEETFDGYTPVFLISKGGQSEKIAFTEAARARFAANGIGFEEVSYEGMLSAADLDAVLDPSRKYVFIPASGSLNEFNKFARALVTYREGRVDPTEVGLFGYPDWTIFRNDASEMLHRLDASFYSRFYADETSAEVRDFKQAYARKFQAEPMATVPSQAMLGYDTATFLIEALRRANSTTDDDNVQDFFAPVPYQGLQSAFNFADTNSEMPEENTPGVAEELASKTGATGEVNSSLYLITYLQGNGVTVRIL